MNSIEVIVLAAGKGTRMRSQKPKVLRKLAGRTMLSWVLKSAQGLAPIKTHVVCGHQSERLKDAFSNETVNWVYQEKQLGTGHAVSLCLPEIDPNSLVVILSGDVPLLSQPTLERLLSQADDAQMVLITSIADNPHGLGRIIRDKQGELVAICEEKDASASEKEIKEVYSGIMMVKGALLMKHLPLLSDSNAQGELYLTELIEMSVRDGVRVGSIQPDEPYEIEGVNDLVQLESLERRVQEKKAEELMRLGVKILDKSRVDFRGEFRSAADVVIDVNVIFEGDVTLESGVSIGPNCVIKDAHLKEGTRVEANTLIEGAVIERNCTVGPFARIRPGTRLEDGAKVGNFVEMKKTTLGPGSKANHLSYVGDCSVGKGVNIGAGTITCNYDGVNKHQTIIEDEAFIGSGTQLVAPVKVGQKATIGAGTTLRQNAPDGKLMLSHKKNKIIEGWSRPKKKE